MVSTQQPLSARKSGGGCNVNSRTPSWRYSLNLFSAGGKNCETIWSHSESVNSVTSSISPLEFLEGKMRTGQWELRTWSSPAKVLLQSVLLTALVLIGGVVQEASDQTEYGYEGKSPDGPNKWGELRPDWVMCAKGRQQSPIQIRTDRAKVDLTLTELNISYNVPSSGYIINEGHALSVEVGDAGHLFLDGQDYTLLHFHFHSPSEHVIDGVQPPLEMHMVHESADGKTLAVIGIPFMEGPPSPFLDQFWSKVPEVDKSQVKVDVGQLVVDAPHLLRVGPKYARYMGSLTTPPCTEGVIWTVALEQSNTVSLEQLRAFKLVLPEPSDRPTQKLHGRDVRLRMVDRQ
ncbi:hypothetical protein R1sor_025087 [Riccia sorocarpa]|uniref:Alpha-carbonic anhydrase domain-containing protein n=1 Tax=Riccia sorocarpa TaxID=122646 RepID=A0ABD3GD98_9MARC